MDMIKVGDVCSIMIHPSNCISLKNEKGVEEFITVSAPEAIKMAPSRIEIKASNYIWVLQDNNAIASEWTVTKKQPTNYYLSRLKTYLGKAVSVDVMLDGKNVYLYPKSTSIPIVKIPNCKCNAEANYKRHGDKTQLCHYVELENDEVEVLIDNFVVAIINWKENI